MKVNGKTFKSTLILCATDLIPAFKELQNFEILDMYSVYLKSLTAFKSSQF